MQEPQTAPIPSLRSADAVPHGVPRLSRRWVRLFHRYSQYYLRRHFHAVQLARVHRPTMPLSGPLVIYLNHPSWWDPLMSFFLAYHLFPEREHYGPMEATALGRYRFLTHLGFFGVEHGTTRGAATFLRVSLAILRRPQATLWITPEGAFTDPRVRPVCLRPGLGHLARRLEHGAFMPLALEYPFWEERFPEALVHFGESVRVEATPGRSAATWTEVLARQLEATQDTLAHAACRRDRAAFDVLLSGRAGVSGVYDLWRAMRARWRGESFHREHGVSDP